MQGCQLPAAAYLIAFNTQQSVCLLVTIYCLPVIFVAAYTSKTQLESDVSHGNTA